MEVEQTHGYGEFDAIAAVNKLEMSRHIKQHMFIVNVLSHIYYRY